ncbi:hypothetical protein [Streptomyces sp. PU-14G]
MADSRWVRLEMAVQLLHERHAARLTAACAGPLPVYLEHRPEERAAHV